MCQNKPKLTDNAPVSVLQSNQEPEQIIQLSFVNWINQYIKKI